MAELLQPPYNRLADYTYDEIYMPFVLCRTLTPYPIMQELWRVAKVDALLEVTVPCGSSDNAWENPTFLRPYYPQSFVWFSQPLLQDPALEYNADWQARMVYIRIPDGLLQQIPEDSRFTAAMTKRNVCLELCAVLQAIKPARKRNDADAIRLPKLQVQAMSQRQS
jgi:hypothetical protein